MPWIGHYTVINPPCFMAFEPLTQDHGSCLGTLMTSCPTQVKAWWQNPPNSWPVIFHWPNRPPKTWNWLISKPSQYHSENTPWYKDAENQPFLVSCCSCWRNTTLRTMCHLPVDPYLVGSCLVSSAMAGVDKKSRCQPVHVSLLSCCLRLLSTVKEHMKRVHVSLHKPSCTFLVHLLLKTNTQIQFIQIQDAYEYPND